MMRDEERIEMYYKFGLLDWENEQQLHKKNDKESLKVDLIYLGLMLEGFLVRIYRILKNRVKI